MSTASCNRNTQPQGSTSGAQSARNELRRLILFVVAMLLAGLACWYLIPPATHATKSWLGRRHLPEVRQSIKDENWQAAAAALRDAKRWAPSDPDVIRASIEFVTHVGGDPRTTILLIRQLQQADTATPDDLALMGTMHARLGEADKARALYAQLPPETRKHTHALELQADILDADGLHARAAAIRREALLSAPDDEKSFLRLAVLDMASSDASIRSAMRERLWQLVRGDAAMSFPAIELLAKSKELTIPEAGELLKRVETTTAAAPKRDLCKLTVLSAQIRLSPQLRTEIIDQEIARWKNRPPPEMTPLMAWLADERESARILRMVPAQTAARYTDLLPHYINALRIEAKWQEMNKLLSSGKIDPAFSAQKIRLWQAEVQAHLDADPAQSYQTLARVFEEAGRGDDLATTLQAANLAEQLNHWEFAERCYQAIATKHPQAEPAMLTKVYQMAGYQHDGPGMLKACSRMLELKPDSVLFLSQKLYLQLLLGMDLEVAQLRLQTVAASAATVRQDNIQLLRAFSAYRQGLPDEMRAALPKIAKPESLAPGERAVYAALLKLSGGDPGTIFRLVERIPAALLLPEEQIFLRRAL